MGYKKKPRAQKRKYIKRRTGAKAQSKQIMSLAKSVGKLTKSNYETIATCWNRPLLSVDTVTGGTTAYLCGLPVSMANCYGQNTVDTAGDLDQRLQWVDNIAIASMSTFRKNPLFGSSENARDSPEVTHMGGYLNYRFVSSEPSFSTYTIALIQPKRRHANQIVVDRTLKNTTVLNNTAGAGAYLTQGVDYITHPDILGTTFNKKFWKVHYKRVHNFSHPNATSINRTVSANNDNPRYNAIIQEGTMKIPGGTVIRNFNRTPYEDTSNPDQGFMKTSASQIGFVDEPPASTCYVCVINNGVSADAETVNLAFLVKDYYKAVV